MDNRFKGKPAKSNSRRWMKLVVFSESEKLLRDARDFAKAQCGEKESAMTDIQVIELYLQPDR